MRRRSLRQNTSQVISDELADADLEEIANTADEPPDMETDDIAAEVEMAKYEITSDVDQTADNDKAADEEMVADDKFADVQATDIEADIAAVANEENATDVAGATDLDAEGQLAVMEIDIGTTTDTSLTEDDFILSKEHMSQEKLSSSVRRSKVLKPLLPVLPPTQVLSLKPLKNQLRCLLQSHQSLPLFHLLLPQCLSLHPLLIILSLLQRE